MFDQKQQNTKVGDLLLVVVYKRSKLVVRHILFLLDAAILYLAPLKRGH